MGKDISELKIVVIGSHGVGKTTFAKMLKEEVDKVIIGVTGSHGTGKTTISKQLAGKFGIKYLPEVAFQAYQVGFQMNEGTSIETQLWIIMKQIEQERFTPTPWISDKCLIDSLAYGLYLIKNKYHQSIIEEMVRRNLNYDIVFYIPIEFPIEDDGFRSLDPVFQKIIDKNILNILKRSNIDYHILTGSREERLKKAKEILGI